MRQLVRNFRLIWVFAFTFWQTISQYRLGAVTWVINAAIVPTLTMAIWLVIGGGQQLALSQSQIVAYFFLTIVVDRITGSWSMYRIGRQIRDGTFSNTLLKPFSYLIDILSHTLSLKFIRLTTLVPIIAIVIIVFGQWIGLKFTFNSGLLFALAAILGFLIRFCWASLLGLATFWLEEFHSVDELDGLIGQVLSGGLIPLALAPHFLGQLITYSPYRYFISFPIELALGRISGFKIAEGFILAGLYLSFLIVLNRIVYLKGLKKYGAYGG